MLQPISALSTEKLLGLLLFQLTSPPPLRSLSGAAGAAFPAGRCGMGAGTPPLPGTCLLPACRAGCPHTGQERGATEQQRLGQGPLHLQKPSWGESWHAAGPRGTALLPPDNILRRHTSPPEHGERKRAQTLLWAGASPAGTAWPPPPPARQGSLSPAPTPPRRAGSSLEREEQL